MTRTAVVLLFAGALLAPGALAQQQSPTQPPDQAQPRQDAARSPQPAKKPLDLRLNDADRRPAVTFAPKDDKKNDPAKNLPGLGGEPTQFLDHPSDSSSGPVIPRTDGYF